MGKSANHPITRKLRENRRRARQLIIISQAQLAQRIDMDPTLVNRIINGRVPAPEGFYAAVALALGCPVSEIMSTEDTVAA